MKKILWLLLVLPVANVFSQNTYAVTDATPVNVNGLIMGYTIKSEEEKEVGNKGNFSRFSVKFYVTNSSSESKIMLYKDGFNPLNNVSDQLAQFNCRNATGARFTSKSATLQAYPCNVLALVDDKDAGGKDVKNKRFVQIGYWLKAGQTVSTSAIMIVPLNQKPDMEVIYLANALQPIASAGYSNALSNGPAYNNSSSNGGQGMPPGPAGIPFRFTNGYVKIRNAFTNNYINIEKGPLSSTAIDSDWWSAQWQIIPVNVNGQQYFNIMNRWKNSYLTVDNAGLLSSNAQSNNALWIFDTQDGGNTYTVKNAARNAALADQNGPVDAIPLMRGQQNTHWIIEQP